MGFTGTLPEFSEWILLNTVADPDPMIGGQLPNPNECNATLTSAVRGIYPLLLGIEYDFSTAHVAVAGCCPDWIR